MVGQQSTTATQRATILALLQRNYTVTSVQLNQIAYRYSARIYELRQEGHLIQTILDHPCPRVTTYRYIHQRPKVRRVKPRKIK